MSHRPPLPLYSTMPIPDPEGPLVPIISVTPHSPAGNQQYPVLEDNLQHLQEIYYSIEQMRNITAAQSLSQQIRNLSDQYARLCSSCPALNEQGLEPDLLASITHSTTNTQFNHDAMVSPENMCIDSSELQRQQSLAALDALDGEGGSHNELKVDRNRSASLSSMESDMEYLLGENTAYLLTGTEDSSGVPLMRKLSVGSGLMSPRRTARLGGNSSTHSLNEADLQSDFNKVLAKCEADSHLLFTTKLPLQKSISTPSILGSQDLQDVEISVADSNTLQNLPDDHSVKRRKRGSIFFRKKKDKPKKNSHQWVTHTVSHTVALICDSCSKPLVNKPTLHCENCSVTVHENSCKEHIPLCSKIKANKAAAIKLRKKSTGSISHSHLLSSNQMLDDKDGDHHHYHDHFTCSDDTPLVPFEFLDESRITAADLDTDPFLGLQEDDADSWMPTVSKDIASKLKQKEVKRQEHIYEFILTEKHHCLTLRVMQKVFVEGILKHFHLAGASIDRMFPRLKDLTEIHLNFLGALKRRQKENPIVNSIADILLEQFSGVEAARLKTAYGEFCSRHLDAVNFYKEHFSRDARFAEFVKHCQLNPLLKKKGIPECILFVTQRLTKYPLLIEPLIKTSKENIVEQEKLHKAQLLIKDILKEVNAQVAEKEKEDRKLEMYNRIDAKSSTEYRGVKFKKSDILNFNRKLQFEGLASLMQGRNKSQEVLVIVLSDVLFFLLEVSQHKYSLQDSSTASKYTFFTPDNKTGVISLQKLLVREKAGVDTRSIYLISSNPAEPEMFELKIVKPREKQAWIEAIRFAVQHCPENVEDSGGGDQMKLSAEDAQTLQDAKEAHIRQIVTVLRQKDVEQSLILEEKMTLQLKLLAASGVPNLPSPPSYCQLVSESQESSTTWQHVMTTVTKVNQLTCSLYTSGSNLSRSVSSVGEHQSQTYISPTLPKRAETFGGFDTAQPSLKNVHKKLGKDQISGLCNNSINNATNSNNKISPENNSYLRELSRLSQQDTLLLPNQPSLPHPSLFTLGQEQQVMALELSHHVYTLSCIIAQQMTTIDSLQAQLSVNRSQAISSDELPRRGMPYRHNIQLEELRNLQDRLQQEKEAWLKEKDNEEKDLEERKKQLLKLQDQVKMEQNDIAQQREQLYHRLEILTSQGILISPNMSLTTTGTELSPPSPPDVQRRKHASSAQVGTTTPNPPLPMHLVSATNQHKKVVPNVHIKQQLPLKLATKLGSNSPSGTQSVNPTSPSTPGMSSGSVVQMLPLKLSSSGSSADTLDRKHKGYTRLVSPGGGEQHNVSSNVVRSGASAPSHARTGSSPAMMQTVDVLEKGSGQKAGRTNTYPKLPEKFRISKTSSTGNSNGTQKSQNPTGDEEVIFF